MIEIRTISRKELIDFYLNIEKLKKGKQVPADYDSLNWDDPNALDNWLQANAYKHGVIAGFREWNYVKLLREDLLDIAVVNHIFHKDRVLHKLVGNEEFEQWTPNREPLPTWYEPLQNGIFKEEFSIILRAPTPGEKKEGARLYVEDGSGRSICYLRTITKKKIESQMCGYIGFDPDPKSDFLQNRLEKEFANNHNGEKYSTIEKLNAEIYK